MDLDFFVCLFVVILAYQCPIAAASFIEKYFSSIELFLHFCQKSIWHICVDLFLDSLFCSMGLGACFYASAIPLVFCYGFHWHISGDCVGHLFLCLFSNLFSIYFYNRSNCSTIAQELEFLFFGLFWRVCSGISLRI